MMNSVIIPDAADCKFPGYFAAVAYTAYATPATGIDAYMPRLTTEQLSTPSVLDKLSGDATTAFIFHHPIVIIERKEIREFVKQLLVFHQMRSSSTNDGPFIPITLIDPFRNQLAAMSISIRALLDACFHYTQRYTGTTAKPLAWIQNLPMRMKQACHAYIAISSTERELSSYQRQLAPMFFDNRFESAAGARLLSGGQYERPLDDQARLVALLMYGTSIWHAFDNRLPPYLFDSFLEFFVYRAFRGKSLEFPCFAQSSSTLLLPTPALAVVMHYKDVYRQLEFYADLIRPYLRVDTPSDLENVRVQYTDPVTTTLQALPKTQLNIVDCLYRASQLNACPSLNSATAYPSFYRRRIVEAMPMPRLLENLTRAGQLGALQTLAGFGAKDPAAMVFQYADVSEFDLRHTMHRLLHTAGVKKTRAEFVVVSYRSSEKLIDPPAVVLIANSILLLALNLLAELLLRSQALHGEERNAYQTESTERVVFHALTPLMLTCLCFPIRDKTARTVVQYCLSLWKKQSMAESTTAAAVIRPVPSRLCQGNTFTYRFKATELAVRCLVIQLTRLEGVCPKQLPVKVIGSDVIVPVVTVLQTHKYLHSIDTRVHHSENSFPVLLRRAIAEEEEETRKCDWLGNARYISDQYSKWHSDEAGNLYEFRGNLRHAGRVVDPLFTPIYRPASATVISEPEPALLQPPPPPPPFQLESEEATSVPERIPSPTYVPSESDTSLDIETLGGKD